MKTTSPYARLLLSLFAAVAAVFTASTFYAEWRTSRVDDEVRQMLDNALPSLAAIGDARAALLPLADSFDELEATPDSVTETCRRRSVQSLARLDAELERYERLPTYTGEQMLAAHAKREIDALRRSVAACLEPGASAADRRAGGRDVLQQVVRTDASLAALFSFNLDRARKHGAEVESNRGRATFVAFGLDSLGVLLAAVSLGLALRAFRRHTAVLEAHGRLLSERADELEQFAARVAHDLRNPLSALSFCLDVVKTGGASDPVLLARVVERGFSSLRSGERIIDGLLDFARSGARPERGARARVRDVALGVVDEARASPQGAVVEWEVDVPEECEVACGPGLLTSVLSNLVRNAVKYSADSPRRRVTVRAEGRGAEVHVEVEDTGPGIAPGLERAIFEPYVRAPGLVQAGVGLGLATVKKICEAHGGGVGLRSNFGYGAVFWFRLPSAERGGEGASS